MDGTRSRGRMSISAIATIALVGLQLACAVVILGLVGVRFTRLSFTAAIYSIVIAVVTIATCLGLGYLAIRPPARRLVIIAVFAWQGALVILWAAVAGVTGREGGTGLRVAMALAIVELFTFLIGSVLNGLVLWRGRSVVNRKMNDTV